jgi:hypothetical protein
MRALPSRRMTSIATLCAASISGFDNLPVIRTTSRHPMLSTISQGMMQSPSGVRFPVVPSLLQLNQHIPVLLNPELVFSGTACTDPASFDPRQGISCSWNRLRLARAAIAPGPDHLIATTMPEQILELGKLAMSTKVQRARGSRSDLS